MYISLGDNQPKHQKYLCLLVKGKPPGKGISYNFSRVEDAEDAPVGEPVAQLVFPSSLHGLVGAIGRVDVRDGRSTN